MAKMFRSTERDDKTLMASNTNPHENLDAAPAELQGQERELAYRDNDGLHVTLLWHPLTDELVVRVWDERQDARFEVRPKPDMALEVYHHPYAYLALAGDVHAT